MNKRLLSLFIALSLPAHAHAFTIKPYIYSTGTRIKNMGKDAGEAITLTAQDIGKSIYIDSIAHLGEHAVASLINHTSLNFDRSKKSLLLDRAIHARIYKMFAHDFLKEFLVHFDINAQQFIDDLPGNTQTKNEYKTAIYEKLCALTITTEHSKIDKNFRDGFAQYKKQHRYDETLKCNMRLSAVATILAAGSLCQLAAEKSIHKLSFLSHLLLNSSNNNFFYNSLYIALHATLPSSPQENGTLLWKYGFKASEKTINRARIVGTFSTLGLNIKQVSELLGKEEKSDFAKLVIVALVCLNSYETIQTCFFNQEPESTH